MTQWLVPANFADKNANYAELIENYNGRYQL